MYKVIMNKHRSTWSYTTVNEVGGSFGSNHCGAKYVALHKALRTVPTGAKYRLVVNGKDQGVHTKAKERVL